MTEKIKIGLLATGTELSDGDILNTNGQHIAHTLTEQGFTIGMHVVVSDQQQEIEQALNFLLQHHSVVVMTGGLGPTSDDRTRFALSRVINQELVFDEKIWQAILARYKQLQLHPHESNRQQALFPANAHVLPNLNGTAAGCWVEYQKKIIYMLPGPPKECLTLFEKYVLPQLIEKYHPVNHNKLKWYLLGAVESDIAASIDAAVKNYSATTGYRIDYPYLEVKIAAKTSVKLTEIMTAVNPIFNPYLISTDNKKASELLQAFIAKFSGIITIDDQATFGALEAALTTPETHPHLRFIPRAEKNDFGDVHIKIEGLTVYWQQQKPTGDKLPVNLHVTQNNRTQTLNVAIPYRHLSVLKYTVEYIAREILFYFGYAP